MRKGIGFSLSCLIGVLSMATMASAGEVTWTNLTDASFVGVGPGEDGLIGTSDDGTDERNATGSVTINMIEWATNDETCPENPGPDEVMYAIGSTKWCMGSPAAGQFEVTSISETNTSVDKIPGGSTLTRLNPGGGPNTGTPCGFDTSGTEFSSTVDVQLLIAGIPVLDIDGFPIGGKIYLASDNSPSPVVCPRVDGGTSTYTTQDLVAIRDLLPPEATAYSVSCDVATEGTDPDPCWDGAMTGNVSISWTSDDVSAAACDGDCLPPDPGSCAGNTADASVGTAVDGSKSMISAGLFLLPVVAVVGFIVRRKRTGR